MTVEGLKLLFGYNHYAIGVNARDLTHEESLIGPHPEGNCANWVLGLGLLRRVAGKKGAIK